MDLHLKQKILPWKYIWKTLALFLLCITVEFKNRSYDKKTDIQKIDHSETRCLIGD